MSGFQLTYKNNAVWIIPNGVVFSPPESKYAEIH